MSEDRFRVTAVVLVGGVAAYALILLAVPEPVAERYWLDHLGFTAPFLISASACWRRGNRGGIDRRTWQVLAAALVCFVVGGMYATAVGETFDPTLADAWWLLFYGLTYVAIVLYGRAHLSVSQSGAWLDGAIGACGLGAVAGALILPDSLADTDGRFLVATVNIAYPVADLLLIMLLCVVGSTLRRFDRSWAMLATGFGVFLVGDVIFLYRVTAGTWEPATALELFWPIGVALIGMAACFPADERSDPGAPAHRYVISAVATASALALLVAGQRIRLPVGVVSLAIAALVLTAVRTVLSARELTQLVQSRQEARTDFLTGLANRRSLSEHLTELTAAGVWPTAVMVIDLDRFKEVNDSLGHVAGDQLLRDVAARLDQALHSTSALLARLGGDEFAVVLPGCTAAEASVVASQLASTLRPAFDLTDLNVHVQASIGIATGPEHGRTATQLLSAADIAMYQAKRSGVGFAVLRPALDSPSRDRLELILDLRTAIERGQFVLHFQPQTDLRSGRTSGVEALVRWRDPRRGLVRPDTFLPLLRDTALMTELTEIVVRDAVAALATMNGHGHDLTMAINVSAVDLTTDTLRSRLAHAAAVFQVAPQSLVIEVTENDVIVDLHRSCETLTVLRDLGVRVSLDDFGTGHATLAYLRDLPFDELKLDRSFLTGVPDDDHNAAIVRSTLQLAQTLRLEVVAEGVESGHALQWLAELGCDRVQGYHVALPMPLDELLAWLARSTDHALVTGAPDIA